MITIFQGVAPLVWISWAVKPVPEALMALTTPAGVSVVTLMVCAVPPLTDKDKSKAEPPFRGVVLKAKPSLTTRCAWATAFTFTW